MLSLFCICICSHLCAHLFMCLLMTGCFASHLHPHLAHDLHLCAHLFMCTPGQSSAMANGELHYGGLECYRCWRRCRSKRGWPRLGHRPVPSVHRQRKVKQMQW